MKLSIQSNDYLHAEENYTTFHELTCKLDQHHLHESLENVWLAQEKTLYLSNHYYTFPTFLKRIWQNQTKIWIRTVSYLSPICWWWVSLSWCFRRSSKVVIPSSTSSFALAGPIPETLVRRLIATLVSSARIWKISC